jgi:hypothetical protein
LAIALSSCQVDNMKGYVKYQTFNEYKLEGVNSSHIKNPYVFVKKELDTVFVIKSNDRRSVMTYINKGEYWFYQEPEEIQKGFIDKVLSKSIWKIFSHPKGVDKTLSKKFITNDTIFIFSYLIMPGTDRGITDAGIIIETPETETIKLFLKMTMICIKQYEI